MSKNTEEDRRRPRDSPSDASGRQLFAEEHRVLGLQPNDAKVLGGLALSGGGIRSATFNLGVLQGLEKAGVLGGFHYVSTVSGGGYIGGFWSAWRRVQQTPTTASAPTDAPPAFPASDSREISHLRSFANFLRPRLPLISFETGRMVAAVAATTVPSLVVTLGVLSAVLLLWLGTTWLVMDLPQRWATGAFLTLLTLGHLLSGVLWRTTPGGESWGGRVCRRLFSALWRLVAIGVPTALWWIAWWRVPHPLLPRILPVTADHLAEGYFYGAFLLPVPILGGAAVLILLRTVTSRLCRTVARRRCVHAPLDRALAATLYMAAGTAIFGLLWVGGQWLAAVGPKGIFTALSASGLGGSAFAWLRKFLGRQPNKPEGGKVRGTAGPWLLQTLAYLTIAAALLAVAAVLSKIATLGPAALMLAVGGTLGLCALPLLFDPEEVGFHSFYRARLARSYLGAATARNSHATQEVADDDFPLAHLSRSRPIHLICCAANNLAGDPIPSLHRGADSAVLSGLGIQVGTHWADWKTRSPPTLGAAMTASAAAFNSHMGARSMRLGQGVTFLLTALNLRLGLWVDNPRSAAPGRAWAPAFYREMFGKTRLTAPRIHLSDGGHFENLGLYELVRRGCRFIVVCDCGADPDYAFDDLGNAIRRIRTDLGVEIDIDPSPIQPGPEGRSPQAAVVGGIRYGTEEPGVLLLIKPALHGDEPTDVLQYAHRSAEFPQQTTLDQFYDEAQWEAYRRLGEHITSGLFARLSRALDHTNQPGDKLRWGLIQALFELIPRGDVTPELHLRLETAWQALEADLAAASDTAPLARQVLGVGTGAVVDPEPEALDPGVAPSLPTLRRALHLMESVCDAYGLHRDAEVAGSICWVNRIGRWALAPLFRAWWPWLAPLYSRDLREFLHGSFQLPSWRGGAEDPETQNRLHDKVEPLAGRTGYARTQWEARHGGEPAGKQGLGYFATVAGAEALIALVWIRWEPSEEEWIATWTMNEFFIPPGLWGMGIGERFRTKLVEYLKKDRLKAIKVRYRKGKPPPPALVALCADPAITLEEMPQGSKDGQRPLPEPKTSTVDPSRDSPFAD